MADLLEFEEPIGILQKEIQALSMLPSTADRQRDIARLEEKLADQLSAVVEIRLKRRARPGKKGSEAGEIAIRFESLDELAGLLDKLGVTER